MYVPPLPGGASGRDDAPAVEQHRVFQSQPAAPAEPPEVIYLTRSVNFLGRRTPIVYQNNNRSPLLLTICNILLLKNVISLKPNISELSQQKLLSLLAKALIIQDKDKDEELTDLLLLLPSLATNIDVNVMFRKIDDFEFIRERAIFDRLDIPLYHGWIVDPQDTETSHAVGSKSYNAIASGIAEFKSGKPTKVNKHMEEDKATKDQWQLIDNFLQTTPNQLTAYGLFCLQEGLNEREFCVLFYNNHFNIMFKCNGDLYILNETDLLWKKLDEALYGGAHNVEEHSDGRTSHSVCGYSEGVEKENEIILHKDVIIRQKDELIRQKDEVIRQKDDIICMLKQTNTKSNDLGQGGSSKSEKEDFKNGCEKKPCSRNSECKTRRCICKDLGKLCEDPCSCLCGIKCVNKAAGVELNRSGGQHCQTRKSMRKRH